jgi:hypothetical protein
LAALAGLVACGLPADGAPEQRAQRVSRAELAAAMAQETGYDAAAITNIARFKGQVFLRLAKRARQRFPDVVSVFIDHDDWYRVYLERVGRTHEQAPIAARLSWENRQDTWLEFARGSVVAEVIQGPEPVIAVNVRTAPQPGLELPASYSYEDTLSRPQLKVTIARVVRYRLLDFGDMIAYDEIDGIGGRPTTGVLAVLFRLIGEAKAVYSRMAIAPDGWQVIVGKGRKGFLSHVETVTVEPDGTVTRGLPKDRPELAALERNLRRPLEIQYHPFPAWFGG